MPRKTKETNKEKTVKKQVKLNEKINALIKNVLEPEEQVVAVEKPAKKANSKSTTSTKAKDTTPKSTKAKAKKESKTKAEKIDTKKSSTTKNGKKSSTEKITTKSIKANEKPISKKSAKTTKAITKKTVTKTTKSKTTKVVTPIVVEYYDLPYKYNQTVVKVLYQNPTTLFVYWEISDSDVEHYKNLYGENFFETTRPVLVVHNETMNYSYEIDINDFANSWYFNINDSKCNYRVELIRRPTFYNERIKTDYIHITSSNKIETPNDRILFSTNEPYVVYFKNTKTNSQRKVNLPKLMEELNLNNKDFKFPIVRNVYDLYKNVYHIEEAQEFSVSLTNPSSRGGNPSSHSLSSRFM